MQKIWFRNNGYIIENKNYDKYLTFYLIKKALAFITDLIIYLVGMFLLIMVFKMSIIYSFIISYFLFFLYTTFTMLILKNKTIGMVLSGLQIGYFDGSRISTGRLMNRAFMTSIYVIPIVGWILAITSTFSAIINKGMTPIDIFSRSQVYQKQWHRNVLEILDHLEKEGE